MTDDRSMSPDLARDADAVRQVYERRSAMVDPAKYAMTLPWIAQRVQERERKLLQTLVRSGHDRLGELDVLEVGCGSGNELARLVALGVDPDRLHGVDLRSDAVEEAGRRVRAHVLEADASKLPYADASFDLVVQFTALSSMPARAMRDAVAHEMWRVTRPGGLIVSYDFVVNPSNRDVVGITRNELKALFPDATFRFQRVTLAPPLARRLGRIHPRLVDIAASVPLLRSHLLASAVRAR
jgi:ubiquinone/menaquinone biosynthesis C-methylase UbiE